MKKRLISFMLLSVMLVSALCIAATGASGVYTNNPGIPNTANVDATDEMLRTQAQSVTELNLLIDNFHGGV